MERGFRVGDIRPARKKRDHSLRHYNFNAATRLEPVCDTNSPSACRIATIAANKPKIPPSHANLVRMEFSETTRSAFVATSASVRINSLPIPGKDLMPPLALIFVLGGLIISDTAAADQTCKEKATEQRLAGAALFSFVKQCEVHAQMACEEAAHKMLAEPTSDRFIHTCVAKAIGAGPRWCVPHHCRDNSDCTGGTGCDVCWAGLCGQ